MIKITHSTPQYYGWAFICPKCYTMHSTGSNDVPKPEFDLCNCDEEKVKEIPKIKLKK